MSSKRSRAAYESDSAAPGAPFVFFGTSILQTRDTGGGSNYIPLHNQEVRDERGRRRLHGAFTGGWSAGYFNTVGSREGWTPSQFRSSRGTRHEADPARMQNLPQDFMDEEDLVDAADSQKLGTSQPFTGIGSRHRDSPLTDKFMSLLHVKSETTGVLLLHRMGWRDGQGIGPKVARKPRLGSTGIRSEENSMAMGNSYLFAPDDIAMIPFFKKTDRSGLGLHDSEGSPHQHSGKTGADESRKSSESRAFGGTYSANRTLNGLSSRRGFGVGVLNDSSSGEDDPYEIGPKITHVRRVRNPRKTKNSARGQSTVQAPSPANVGIPWAGGTCLDEHDPHEGFVRRTTEDVETGLASQLQSSFSVPAWWVPPGRAVTSLTAENTRMHPQASSSLPPTSVTRGRMLGEPEAFKHDNLSSRPEPGAESVRTTNALSNQIPQPTRQAAEAALGREQEGRGPYPSQPLKRQRYHRYLEYHAGLGGRAPTKPEGMADLHFTQELAEFYNCVVIFKPMVAPMASRFTAATASMPTTRSEAATEISRDKDTPREAARLDMFGDMTRSIVDFIPSSLLCKRFNVTLPRSNVSTGRDHARPSGDVAPCIDISGKGPTLERQCRPAAKGREIPSGKADIIGNPAESEHVSEQVFDAIFGDKR